MTTKTFRFVVLLLVLFSLTSANLPAALAQAPQTAPAVDLQKSLAAIEEKLEARRKVLGIPGVGFAIVKDDKIIYSKGLGYKDFEKKIPATADTQFAIGSATKAFTALTVLMAADEGKLSLEDSPKKYLPYFKMYDPDTDKNITIRDLLCHSSGLNRTDLAMITGKLRLPELIQVVGEAKPAAKLREKFQYQNIMFAAAGEIASTVEKTPYEKLVATRIFKPLGMKNSNLSITDLQKAKDYSFGYSYNFDTALTERLPFRGIGDVAPAGAINSSANDMAQWLRFVLNGGAVNGKRLVSEKNYDEWTKPQMTVAGKMSYGFGWFIQDWNGLKVIQHGGNIDGFNSMVAMIPEKHLGFVLLTNVSASSLGNDMMSVVWSNILNGPQPVELALSAADLLQFAGTYRLDKTNFDVQIAVEDGKLTLSLPGQHHILEQTGARKFKIAGAPDDYGVNFSPADGQATELELLQPGRSNKAARVTAAAPDTTPKSSAAAKELVGKYLNPGGDKVVDIVESDGRVTFNILGQQPYTLNEKGKDTFTLSPLPEDTYWVKVKHDEAGKVSSVTVVQPEGEFEFKKAADDSSGTPKLTADELMEKIIAAYGGADDLRKVTSRVTEADIDFENQGVKGTSVSYATQGKAATSTTLTALGKKIGEIWEYFDGTNGGESYTFSPEDHLSGKRLDDARLSADLHSLADWKTLFKKVEVVGTTKIGDEKTYIVSFEPIKGTAYREFYSADTFLCLRHEGVVASSTSGQSTPYTISFSDYRDIDGIKIPFKTVANSVSQGNIVTTVRSVKQNISVDDKLFAPRKLR